MLMVVREDGAKFGTMGQWDHPGARWPVAGADIRLINTAPSPPCAAAIQPA
ncbi:MAG: hypothetical protein OZ932_12295 [Flavobacteriia bacterium]|nr:hypothetical protein [Flavobacteriia bacterium]